MRQALKNARSYLFRISPEKQATFLQLLSRPLKGTQQVIGPATALREYLLKIGWICSPQGEIQINAYKTCHIMNSPFQELEQYMVLAWQEQLLMFCTERKKLYHHPPIDKFGVIRALQGFNEKEKLLLLREIAGAFQTKHQQQQWDPSVTSICDWCGVGEDSRQHRVLECNAFQELRLQHAQILPILEEEKTEWCDLPVLSCHPEACFHAALHDAMPTPTIEQELRDRLQYNKDFDSLQFYTDGSCRHSESPGTRYSSYSIIVDLAEDNSERKQLAERFAGTRIFPPTLQRIAWGRLPGKQNIHRAELVAVLWLCEHFTSFTVFTDSAFVVDIVHKCRQWNENMQFAHHPDFDLIRRLKGVLTDCMKVAKIKAHRNIPDICNLLERYRALGNAMADAEAVSACLCLFPELQQRFEQFHIDYMQDLEKLKLTYKLLLELQIARKRSTDNSLMCYTVEESVSTLDPRTMKKALHSWVINQPWQPSLPWNTTWLSLNSWGVQIMHAVQSWMMTCVWPANEEITADDLGISWTEVAVALMLHHKQLLPVKREKDGKVFVTQPTSPAEVMLVNTSMSEQTQVAFALVQHFRSHMPEEVLPVHIQQGKIKSMYMQGHAIWTTGLKRRPSYPLQGQVCDILEEFLTRTNRKLEGLPKVDFPEFKIWNEDIQQKNVDWLTREKRSKKALLAVRTFRGGG